MHPVRASTLDTTRLLLADRSLCLLPAAPLLSCVDLIRYLPQRQNKTGVNLLTTSANLTTQKVCSSRCGQGRQLQQRWPRPAAAAAAAATAACLRADSSSSSNSGRLAG